MVPAMVSNIGTCQVCKAKVDPVTKKCPNEDGDDWHEQQNRYYGQPYQGSGLNPHKAYIGW